MKKAISYYRVSTDRQGQSALGLEAQQKSVHDYLKSSHHVLISEFTEVESGCNNRRPILEEALAACKREKAMLLIAKIDRLARNVAFIAWLIESNVEFVAVDNPYATKFYLHIMAAFAEHERDQISARTKAALAAAKVRGVELGKHGKYILSVKNREAADVFASEMQPKIDELKACGIKTIRAICEALNLAKVATFHGGVHWHVQTVHNLLKRQKALSAM